MEGPFCACTRVIYKPIQDMSDGSWTEDWVCDTCGTRFVKRTRAERAEALVIKMMTPLPVVPEEKQTISILGAFPDFPLSYEDTLDKCYHCSKPYTEPAGCLHCEDKHEKP